MGTAAPIIMTVYPRNDGVFSRRLVVAIRIPTSYQQEPPTPTDSAIRIEERPGMTVYALYVSFKVVLLLLLLFDVCIQQVLWNLFQFAGSLEASQGRASTEQRPCVWHVPWARRPPFSASSTSAVAMTRSGLTDAEMRFGSYRRSHRRSDLVLNSLFIFLTYSHVTLKLSSGVYKKGQLGIQWSSNFFSFHDIFSNLKSWNWPKVTERFRTTIWSSAKYVQQFNIN